MFCGNCGQENPAANRFCGMCGTPLPQRPLTAPGAQSTIQFTRLPMESPRVAPRQAIVNPSVTRQPLPTNPQTAQAAADQSSEYIADNSVHGDTAEDEAAVPPSPLATEPSLERFVEQFKYEPPTESELTMGGTPIPHTERFRPMLVPPQLSEPVSDISRPQEKKGFLAAEPSSTPAEPVKSGIGLIDSVEEPAERPRFLDLESPPAAERPRGGMSTIVGPSFLGLSDEPDVAPQYEEEMVDTSSSHWRIWLALIIVAVFGVLGLLEWRSQTHQTTGPLEVLKIQLHRLKHGNQQDAGTAESQPASPTDNGNNATKPEMQVEPQPKPPDSTNGAATGTTGAPPNATPNTATPNASGPQGTSPETAAPQNYNTPIGNQPPSGSNSTQPQQPVTTKAAPDASTAGPSPNVANSKAPTTVADDAAAPATTKRAPVAEDDEVVTRKIVPGQEEMAKADHASDAAAAAAWLWKATAKGNPEAPVRLSDMYIRGDGVPRSCDQALVLLKSAAEKQNARARNRLASMYATGTCVPRDRVQAYRWLSLALISDPSSEWAQQNRSLIWRQMTAEEKAAAAKYQTK